MAVLAKLACIEMKLFLREPATIVFVFAFPLVVLTVLAGVFGPEDVEEFDNFPPEDYYLASYAGVVVAAIGLIALPVHVAGYRERGILRRFRASSVSVWTVFGALVVVSFVMAVLGTVVLALAGTLLYDAGLPDSYGAVLVAFVVGTPSILGIGFLLAALVPTARAAQGLGMVLFFPMWLLSGAGPPPDVMSDGMRTVADWLPLTYVVRALQDAWLGRGSFGGELVVLAGIMVVTGALSVRLLRAA